MYVCIDHVRMFNPNSIVYIIPQTYFNKNSVYMYIYTIYIIMFNPNYVQIHIPYTYVKQKQYSVYAYIYHNYTYV